MKKVTLFSFNGELMCFIHVLLNALNMKAKGYDVRVVIEGASTKLLSELKVETNPLHEMFKKALQTGIIDGVCRACSAKMGTLKDAEEIGLALLDDMSGHPSMSRYIDNGYEIITF
ncbi:MAG: DsrE family protein [Thermodesulfovibrionales bacterium]|nr:DsrE family protein [Thermodesulfovibrionales bacterium]